MGRRSVRSDSNKFEIFIVGEQLRVQMTEQNQVRDRRYHLRKYRKCFIGRDAIDWLLKLYHVQSREEAMTAMQILQKNGVIHHVTDEHDFKDQHLFYRFTFDDDTYKIHKDLACFYRGLEIYRKLKQNLGEVMRDFYHKGSLCSEAFYGSDAVDFVVVSEGAQDRESVIQEFRDLLERDIIKHVTDDYHFSDDKLIYEFNLDFKKPCLLHDVIELMNPKKNDDVIASPGDEDVISPNLDRTSPVHIKSSKNDKSLLPRDSVDSAMSGQSSSPGSGNQDMDSESLTSQGMEPRSVLIRPATVQELEDPRAPYVKRSFQMECDAMGYGLVLRGSSPCYVQTIDPLGPAAAAGLKVRQFISSVNGRSVLRMDHRQVGLMINQSTSLSLAVLTYRRESDRM